MKRLILHIGTHKTGTTSLQKFFAENQSMLEKRQHILYPVSGRPKTDYDNRYGHHLLAWYFLRKNGVVDNKDWKYFKDECVFSDAETILLSSEDFGILEERDIVRLREYLRGFDVSVVIYLRNPIQYIRSAYKQQVCGRSKLTLDFLEFTQKNIHRCDYTTLIDHWGNVFGKGRITVRAYDAVISRATLERDFLDILGIKDMDSFEFSSSWTNKSVSDKTISLVIKLNILQKCCVKSTTAVNLLQKIKRKIIRNDAGSSSLLSPFTTSLFSGEESQYLYSELDKKNDVLVSHIGQYDFKYLRR